VARQLSVRQTEALVKRLLAPPTTRAAVADVHTRAAEQELKLALGAPVRIVRGRKGGRIEIDFKSEDDLQRLYEALNRR
jgi:ParB family chromosome partitioning protein